MPTYRGTKNLHLGNGEADDAHPVHAVRDYEGGGYVIEVDDKTAAAVGDYLQSEGFTLADPPAKRAK